WLYLYRKISTLLQKRSLNAIQFEKIIAYQAIWRTPTILSNAYKQSHSLVVFYAKKDDEQKLIVFIYLLVLKA
ncbi:hypothetical protein, partial [Enterococcus cecorum]|uniref:hypothetical protein n=1 Tax=Enterococcus cecorum TaxID=44008 RepID=UPI001FAD65DB